MVGADGVPMRWLSFAVVLAGCPTEGEICGNGEDDDADGLIDCQEPLCRCSEAELCTGGLDEDGDELVDCADPDCGDVTGCSELLCADGLDDDGDELVDCLDADCDGECPEVCADGRDNDGNGLTDCEDAVCADEDACGELLCADGLDDDGDGDVDCADDDCWGLACHPQGIRSEITGGSLDLTIKLKTVRTSTSGKYYTTSVGGNSVAHDCGPGDTSEDSELGSSGQLLAVTGRVRVKVPGDGGSVDETCEFGFERGVLDGRDGALGVTRSGFWIDDPARCRLARSSWLPTLLTRDFAMLRVDDVRRYAAGTPRLDRDYNVVTRTTEFRDSCFRHFSSSTDTTSLFASPLFGDELLRVPSR
jgi:hypothetical protein